ncbi:MAG: tRNA threonylcarbamoyladenosine dehydratase [Sutterellaceae bacterium]|nr:tRNA threonylcarbamoyladenosine dehydratase [Sutterellaceae bacterium]
MSRSFVFNEHMNSSDTRRFGGIARLYSNAGLAAFQNAHVCVIGLGGVGSWCAEALCRTCVGKLTLIDMDTVAESNINRQLPATGATVGLPKVEVLAERFKSINPNVDITTHKAFASKDNFEEIIPADALIVDAIDSLSAKIDLIAWAKANGRTIFVSGGAGGRVDPSRIQTSDLACVKNDALLSKVRAGLRKSHGFPTGSNDPKKTRKFGITAVFSDESGRPCAADAAQDVGAQSGFGTAVVVTASLGLRLANAVLAHILTQQKVGSV